MKKNIIKFNTSAKADILDALDLSIDSENYIVEKSNPQERVITKEGDEVPASKLAAISKGSLVFTKSDLHSLFSFVLGK